MGGVRGALESLLADSIFRTKLECAKGGETYFPTDEEKKAVRILEFTKEALANPEPKLPPSPGFLALREALLPMREGRPSDSGAALRLADSEITSLL